MTEKYKIYSGRMLLARQIFLKGLNFQENTLRPLQRQKAGWSSAPPGRNMFLLVLLSNTGFRSSGLAPAVKLPSPEPKRVTQSSAKFR